MELTATKYKQTEVGLIPEDWDLVPFDKVFTFHSTSNYSKAQMSDDDEVGCIHYGLIHAIPNTQYNLKNGIKYYVSSDQAKYDFVRDGDVIMVDASEDLEGVNKSVEVCGIGNKKYISGLHTYLLRDKNGSLADNFRGILLNSQLVKNQMLQLAVGMKVFGVSKTQLIKVKLPLPPSLTEQKAIAQVLSDTDALIQALEKKIAKKKLIKIGVMQKLLTPKEDWEVKAIKNIVSTPVTDGPHETPEFISSGVPFLSVNNIVNNKIDKSALRYISKSDDTLYSKKCKPQKHDILLGKAASVGKIAIVEDNWNFNVWSPLALIRLKSDISPYFIYYMFQTYELLSQIDGLTNSSSQGNIGMVDIEKLTIPIPKESELQESIANVFINIDKEIAQLEQKRSKYQLAKQGMMQQLLTGKIRLV